MDTSHIGGAEEMRRERTKRLELVLNLFRVKPVIVVQESNPFPSSNKKPLLSSHSLRSKCAIFLALIHREMDDSRFGKLVKGAVPIAWIS